MKKKKILSILSQIASPAALILVGAVLLFSPDSASVLIARVLGWGFLIAGAGFGIAAFTTHSGTTGKVIGALACLSVGTWLTANPLALAAWVGRILGILLLIRGGRDFFQSNLREGKILSGVVAALGLVLIVLPMTTSRLVFSLCGLVILILGIAMLVERLRERRYLDAGDHPDIIDAL